MKRSTQSLNVFSKNLEYLETALASRSFHYNFMRLQQTLRVTPAMEAGTSKHLRARGSFWDSIPSKRRQHNLERGYYLVFQFANAGTYLYINY
jgi:hypothetical protein